MVTDEQHPEGRPATPALLVAGAASAAAGLVHAAAAGTHNGDTQLTWLFAVTAIVQLGWGAWAASAAMARDGTARRRNVVAATGLALGAAAVGAWILSRTTGLPVVESLAEREDVGLQDAIAAVLGGTSMLLSVAALRGTRPVRRPLARPAPMVAAVALLALALPGVAATHTHGPSHEHEGGHGDHADADMPAASSGGHAHGDGEGADGEVMEGHAGRHEEHEGPVISLTDPRVSEDERESAQQLIDATIEGMARFSTVESVQAAGYVTIGDGVTGWEHFVHVGNIADGVELDPERIESVVFKVHPDGTRQLASAMYILDFGKTMDDVPDVAGELTTWHDHQDLCWVGVRVVATTDAAGNCPRGVFRGTSPMLHVWMIPHRCGPFAGIEGSHGSGCGHAHGDNEGATTTGEESGEETAAGP